MKIVKYQLETDGASTYLPSKRYGRILNVISLKGQPYVWIEIDEELEECELIIDCYGTDWQIERDLKEDKYIGSAMDSWGCIWHYYRRKNNYEYDYSYSWLL